MLNKTQMSGDMPFGENKPPLLATAVGVGYLKQPLRYLTQSDLQIMGNRTQVLPRPSTNASSSSKLQAQKFGGIPLHNERTPSQRSKLRELLSPSGKF